jgi:hypothetical protein
MIKNLTLYSNKSVFNLNELFDEVRHAGTFKKKLDGGHFSFSIMYNEMIYNHLKKYGGILEVDFGDENKEYYYIYPKNVEYKKMQDDKYVEEIEIYAHHIKNALIDFIYFPKDDDPTEIKEKFKLENGYLSQDNIKFCLEKLFEVHMPTIPNVNVQDFPIFNTTIRVPQRFPIKSQGLLFFEKKINEAQPIIINQEEFKDKMAGTLAVFEIDGILYICEYYIYFSVYEEWPDIWEDNHNKAYAINIKLIIKKFINGAYQKFETSLYRAPGYEIIGFHAFKNRQNIYFFIVGMGTTTYYTYSNLLSSYQWTIIQIDRVKFDTTNNSFSNVDNKIIYSETWNNVIGLKLGFVQAVSNISKYYGTDANPIIHIIAWFGIRDEGHKFTKHFRVDYDCNNYTWGSVIEENRPNTFEARDVHQFPEWSYFIEAYVDVSGEGKYDLVLYRDDFPNSILIGAITHINTKAIERLPLSYQDNYSARIIHIEAPNFDIRYIYIALSVKNGVGIVRVEYNRFNNQIYSVQWNYYLTDEDPVRLELLYISENEKYLLVQSSNNLYICDVSLLRLLNWQSGKVDVLPALKVKLASKIVYNKVDYDIAIGYAWKRKINNYPITILFGKLLAPSRQPFLNPFGIGIPYQLERKVWEDEDKKSCSVLLLNKEHPYVWHLDDIETGYSFLRHIKKIEDASRTAIVINNSNIKVVYKYPLNSDIDEEVYILTEDDVFSVNYFTATNFKQIWFHGFAIQDEPPKGAEDTLLKIETEIWMVEELLNRLEKFKVSDNTEGAIGIELKVVGIRYFNVGSFIFFQGKHYMITEIDYSLPSNTTEIRAIEVKYI